MFDIVLAGHFCIDSIFLPSKQIPYVVLGGSVTYASIAARRLGASVSIISKVGEDFPEAYLWWLKQEGIDLSGVAKLKDMKTTRFKLTYSEDFPAAVLQLTSKAAPITVEDLPSHFEARIIHLAPIANEISHEVAEKLKGFAEVLSMDPQGLVRVFNESGNVTLGTLLDKRLLELVDVYKSSLDEIEVITGEKYLKSAIRAVHDYGVETVMVTLGVKGVVLSINGAIYKIPAYTQVKLVDPTGAGDAFMGGFLAEYVRGKEALWCACVGSAAASMVVEGIGPTSFSDSAEIYRRADTLCGKEIKQ